MEYNREVSKDEKQMTENTFFKVQYPWPSGKYKSKLLSDFILPKTEWLRSLKKHNDKCWYRYGAKGRLILWWWKCKLVQPQWKSVWTVFKNLKRDLPHDPATQLMSIYSKISLSCCMDICLCMFVHHCSIHNTQEMESAPIFIRWWTNNENLIDILMEYYLSI